VARVTNYARKFFGKRMQKVKVPPEWGEGGGRGRGAIEIERKAGRTGGGAGGLRSEGAAGGDDSSERVQST